MGLSFDFYDWLLVDPFHSSQPSSLHCHWSQYVSVTSKVWGQGLGLQWSSEVLGDLGEFLELERRLVVVVVGFKCIFFSNRVVHELCSHTIGQHVL